MPKALAVYVMKNAMSIRAINLRCPQSAQTLKITITGAQIYEAYTMKNKNKPHHGQMQTRASTLLKTRGNNIDRTSTVRSIGDHAVSEIVNHLWRGVSIPASLLPDRDSQAYYTEIAIKKIDNLDYRPTSRPNIQNLEFQIKQSHIVSQKRSSQMPLTSRWIVRQKS